MAGNFHGVLIFVIFVVELAFMKFPSMKINAYRDDGHGQSIVAAQPTILSVSKQQ